MGKAPLFACAALACSCGSIGLPTEDLPATDSGTVDSSKGSDIDASPSGTRLVVVHTGEPKLQPFRVCVDDTELPQPSDPSRPMPKSNYPGIPIGGAAYVGQVAPGPLSLRLYDALTLANENRATETCGKLKNDTTLPAFAHEDVDTTGVIMAPGALNLVGVYGDLGQSKAVSAVLDSSFTTASDPLEVALGHLSPDHQTTKIIGAFSARDGGAPVALGAVGFGAVGSLTKTTFPLDASAASYDDYGIAISSPPQFFSLTDVAQATDPTQAPSALLSGRTHFAFVLVGYDIVPDGGPPEQLLHLVAIAHSPVTMAPFGTREWGVSAAFLAAPVGTVHASSFVMTSSRLAVVLLACSGLGCAASEASTGSPGSDTQPDAGADLDAAFLPTMDGAAPATILVFVHGGSHDLAPFRVCIDPAGTPLPSDFAHPMPLANYPGIPVGGASSLGDVDDKVTLNVTLIDALALAGLNQSDPRSKSCSNFTLLSPAAHEAIAGVTLVRGAVNVAIVLGSAGSRTVKVVTLDATPPADKKIRLQWGQFATGLGSASASFGNNGSAGAALGTVAEGAIAAGSVEVDFDPGSPPTAFDTSGVAVTTTGAPRFFSLTDIQSATDPTTVPTQFFTTRVSFGVLAIGDANAVDAGAGEGVHLLAIPAQL